jgi:hypothetical protein
MFKAFRTKDRRSFILLSPEAEIKTARRACRGQPAEVKDLAQWRNQIRRTEEAGGGAVPGGAASETDTAWIKPTLDTGVKTNGRSEVPAGVKRNPCSGLENSDVW